MLLKVYDQTGEHLFNKRKVETKKDVEQKVKDNGLLVEAHQEDGQWVATIDPKKKSSEEEFRYKNMYGGREVKNESGNGLCTSCGQKGAELEYYNKSKCDRCFLGSMDYGDKVSATNLVDGSEVGVEKFQGTTVKMVSWIRFPVELENN